MVYRVPLFSPSVVFSGIPLFKLEIKIPLPTNTVWQCLECFYAQRGWMHLTETMLLLDWLPVDVGPEFNVNESTTCIKYTCL